MLDSNLEFRIAESWAWIAKSEFSGSIGNSCIAAGVVAQQVRGGLAFTARAAACLNPRYLLNLVGTRVLRV